MREAQLFKTILISTDGTTLANRGLEHGLALARQLNSAVVIVTVTDAPADPGGIETMGAYTEVVHETSAHEASARKVLDAAAVIARAAGIEPTLVHVANTFAADGIVATATKHAADLIVMASHGRRGVGRLLLGSQTVDVLTHTTIPVLVVR
jgi:nucleotide-binding universal stress UspA family protein